MGCLVQWVYGLSQCLFQHWVHNIFPSAVVIHMLVCRPWSTQQLPLLLVSQPWPWTCDWLLNWHKHVYYDVLDAHTAMLKDTEKLSDDALVMAASVLLVPSLLSRYVVNCVIVNMNDSSNSGNSISIIFTTTVSKHPIVTLFSYGTMAPSFKFSSGHWHSWKVWEKTNKKSERTASKLQEGHWTLLEKDWRDMSILHK